MDEKWKAAGERLREIRKETNLSVYKVARRTHITGNYLAMLERGLNAPSDTVLFNLSEFYNIDPSELFKLYNKVVPPTDEQLKKMPSLKGLITKISIDPKLTSEEKDIFATQLYKIVNDLSDKE